MTDSSYWPWWLGALALGAVALGFWRSTGRILGVSGIFMNFLEWRRTKEIERAARALRAAAPDRVERALLEATRRAFPGGAPPGAPESPPEAAEAGASAGSTGGGRGGRGGARALPPIFTASANAVFLVAVVAGAALASFLQGAWTPRLTLGPEFERLIGEGGAALAILFGGGLLVGAGTSMAGGCTSGHGLCGTSRLQRGSLVTTATFLGTAMAVSWLLGGRGG